MSIISVSLVLAFYKCAPILPKFIANKFEQVGVATYGIYLLHPIVMDSTRWIFQTIGVQVKYLPTLVAIGLTINISVLTYKYFEAPLMNLGKRLTKRAIN
jgi:exopolysaccharide production protein ExoZ